MYKQQYEYEAKQYKLGMDTNLRKLKQLQLLFQSLLIVFSLFMVLIMFNNKDNLVNVFGFELNVVQSNSMHGAIEKYDIVIIRKSNVTSIGVGDIIAYRRNNIKIIHRVINITEDGLITKGDNNLYSDNVYITKDNYYGKYVCRIPFGGLPIMFALSPAGFVVISVNVILWIILNLYYKLEDHS